MKKQSPGVTTALVLILAYCALFIALVILRNQEFWNQRKASAALVEIVPVANQRQSVFTRLYNANLMQEIDLLKVSYSYPEDKSNDNLNKIIATIKSDDSLFQSSEKLLQTNKEHELYNQLKSLLASRRQVVGQFIQQLKNGAAAELIRNYEDSISPVYTESRHINSQLLKIINNRDQKVIKDIGLKIIDINNINIWISAGLIILLISLGFNLIILGKKGQKTTYALKESERKYRTLTEQSNEIIEKCDPDGRFVFANESFKKRFEYNDEELSKLTIGDLLDEGTIELDRAVSQGNLLTNVQRVFRSKSGKKIYLEGTIFLEYSNGIFGGSMGFFNDVTEKKKLEESLIASESKFRKFFSLAPIPMWVIEPETNQFLSVNKAACDHYGYTESEFLKMTVLDIRKGDDTRLESKEVQRVKREILSLTPDKIKKFNFYHVKKGGEKMDVEIYTSPILINDRQCILSISLDVTERYEIENKITKAIIKTQEDERYEIGGELHDNVCQILAAAKMSLGMIKSSLPEGAIDSYNKSCDAILFATKEIRNLSHRLAPAFFDNTRLETAFESLLRSFNIGDVYNIAINFDKRSQKILIKQEAQLNLYRILQEQLRNIIEHAHCSAIEVNVIIWKNNLQMRISDNGVGFNVKEVKYGIGIANMKRRAELFSGHIYLNSSINNGCELIIVLPLEKII